jgi:hypothetical protein
VREKNAAAAVDAAAARSAIQLTLVLQHRAPSPLALPPIASSTVRFLNAGETTNKAAKSRAMVPVAHPCKGGSGRTRWKALHQVSDGCIVQCGAAADENTVGTILCAASAQSIERVRLWLQWLQP